jgi:WD40 repeat protein
LFPALSNKSRRWGLRALYACCLLFCGGVVSARSDKTAAIPEQQNSFRVYTLDTGSGTLGADIDPDGRSAAVESYTWEDSTQLVEEIQLWDFHDHKLISRKDLARVKVPKIDEAGLRRGFVRFADSGRKIIVCECTEGHLLVFDSKTLDELQNIDLGMSSWPRFPESLVIDVQVDARGGRAAVLLEQGIYGGGELRVYEPASGALLRKWDFQDVGFGRMSIDPQGQRIAIPVLPFVLGARRLRADERNLQILDVDSGKTVSEINTGYIAAAVAFIGQDRVATVSANPDVKHFDKDTIKIWDVETGRLIHQISSEPGGVHDTVLVSGDRRVALGYVGLDKLVGHWWADRNNVTVYRRFRLWNLGTDEVIATSPDLPQLVDSAFALSAKGDVVLVYPVARGGMLHFYEIR